MHIGLRSEIAIERIHRLYTIIEHVEQVIVR